MTNFYHSLSRLDLNEILAVYSFEDRQADALNRWQEWDETALRQCFYDHFDQPGAFVAVERSEDRYGAVLRAMPYRDGWLIAGLETAPALRGKGLAKSLVDETLKHLFSTGHTKVYSHVKKDNVASLAVHKACGFEIINDVAALLDGSVVSTHCTLRASK